MSHVVSLQLCHAVYILMYLSPSRVKLANLVRKKDLQSQGMEKCSILHVHNVYITCTQLHIHNITIIDDG